MGKPNTTQPVDRPAATTTLFDPFWSAGKPWQAAADVTRLARCEVIPVTQALEALAGLAEQFQSPTEGWKGLLLTPPGLDCRAWSIPAKQALIANLIPTVVPLERDVWVFLLPDNRLVMVLHFPNTEGLVKAVYGVAGLLVGDAAAPRTTVQLADLGKQPERLSQWVTESKARFSAETTLHLHHHQRAQLNKVSQVLSSVPIVTQRRVGRAKPFVLIVEDDPSTAMLLETLLGPLAEVAVAHSAHDAAQLYPRHVPNLVFLDIGLPDVTGLELLAVLHQADNTAHVVMLTANATHANLATARTAGAKGFLAKPFTREKLQQALSAIPKV